MPASFPTVSAVATKKSKDAKVGISFANRDGVLVIHSLKDGGLFKNTDIVPGLPVVSINGVDCEDKTPADAAAMLKDAEKGNVTIVAKGVVAVVKKKSKDLTVGITLQRDSKTKAIKIVSLSEDGLFANSDLQVGMKVVSINGQICPRTTKEAIELIKTTKGNLKIVATELIVAEDKEEEAPEEPAVVAAPEGGEVSPTKDDENKSETTEATHDGTEPTSTPENPTEEEAAPVEGDNEGDAADETPEETPEPRPSEEEANKDRSAPVEEKKQEDPDSWMDGMLTICAC